MSSTATVINDLQLKAPRFIDYHPATSRSGEEVRIAKNFIKEFIRYCVETAGKPVGDSYGLYNDTQRNVIIVDLSGTEHIAKACIKIFADFARSEPGFIVMARPKQSVRKELLENGFPEANIQSSVA
ncbi:MAG: hypothetical protein HY811_01545 [Planctomycetes bacterium]|nr:hypothetical protein [Planctomycetota bacterium]